MRSPAAGPPPAWVATAAGLTVSLDEAGVLMVRLARPDTYNAVDRDLLDALGTSLERTRGRDDVRVVVLTGTGKAFCAGATLAGDNPVAEFGAESMTSANRVIRAIVGLDKPVLAGVNGVAAGYGAALAFAADLQLACAEASFALTFTTIGLMPDGGTSATIAAAVGRPRAMRMALLGERMSARDAYAAGLVSHLVEGPDFESALSDLAARLARSAPLAFAATKKAVNAATLTALEDSLDREALGQMALFTTADAAEGMASFVQKRAPRFTGR